MHTYSFGDAWKSDDISHWHECECGEKSGVAAHTLGTDGKCTVCDFTIPKDNKVTKEE